ncbi:MAG: alpha/beta fold hydrolase [Thiolinea sp.]
MTNLLLCILLLAGCTTASKSFDNKADALGFRQSHIRGAAFSHTLFSNGVTDSNKVLNVYLGGDGTPWFAGRYVTRDPTPLKPVMLSLMKMDRHPAIYLGRPCYHQKAMPENCHKSLWTSRRYSAAVVDSMVTALKRYVMLHGYQKIRLFGFSGGGTLGVLMAPQLPQTEMVVTLAGNLNPDAWAEYHGFLPLQGSLNPSRQPALPVHITQFHIVGSRDQNMPAFLSEAFVRKQQNARYALLDGADHHCCWNQKWSELLAGL